MRWILVSIVVHAAVIAALVRGRERLVAWQVPRLPAYQRVETTTLVELLEEPAVKGGGGGGPRAARAAARSPHGWEQVDIRSEATGTGTGEGGGTGAGHGAGIGFGEGGGIRVARDVPVPPPPPAISKARPAKLVWPTRDEEVDDEDNLFVARVTVDAEGSVVGATMVTTRPGSRGDHAANLIWQFRYAPALDDRGIAIRSTFEQPFQVR